MFARDKACIALFLAVLTACPAMAETADHFGHRISIEDRHGEDEGSQSLRVDGKELASADHIFIEKSGTVGDVNVIVTALHIGGVFCAPQSTLVVFVKDKPPQLVAPRSAQIQALDKIPSVVAYNVRALVGETLERLEPRPGSASCAMSE